VNTDRGVIFDMDGVLINSEPLHFLATQEILATYGVPMSEADYYGRYIVYSDWEIMELLLPTPRRDPRRPRPRAGGYLELVAAGIPPFPTVCSS